MKNVKIADLEPGSVTAMDVLASDGRRLLSAGTKLTSRHIRTLRARGIEHVAVASGQRSRGAARTPAAGPADIDKRIAQRFQHSDPAHPLIKELVRICESRLSKRE